MKTLRQFLPFLLFLTCITYLNSAQAQCVGTCTQSLTGTGLNVNGTNAADVICIIGPATISSINNISANDQICIVSGTVNLPNNSLNFGGTSTTAGTINVASGATVNWPNSGTVTTGSLKINNAGTFNFTGTSNVSLGENGGSLVEFNNLTGGVLNALTMPRFVFNSGTDFNNEGVMNFNNLELAESQNPTNTANGVINIKRVFYVHSFGFLNLGKINATCQSTGVAGADAELQSQTAGGCGFAIGDKGSQGVNFGAGSCTKIIGNVNFAGPSTVSGYIENNSGPGGITGDFTTSKPVTGGGGTIVIKNGVSTLGPEGIILTGGLQIYDVNNTTLASGKNGSNTNAVNGVDANNSNGANDVFTIPTSLPANPCETILPSTIGNRVFLDNNNNGVFDGGDANYTGTTKVYLYKDADNSGTITGLESTVPADSTTTNATGIYSFTGLTPGAYQVGVVLPSGYLFSTNTNTADNETGTATT
ncbi:MAG: hypothetical protein KA210_12245, partial [Bacteroidia bacterium]|nr:hypothetical protein [Bacteroidia bacterium]